MTPNFLNGALLNLDMPSWYYDGVTAKTRNLGTLGGAAQLGDGTTVGTFPSQAFPSGMSFNGTTQYLLYPDSASLTFGNGVTDQPFSVEVLFYGNNFCLGKGFAGTTQEWAIYSSGPVTARQILFAFYSSPAAFMYRNEVPTLRPDVLNYAVGTYDGSRTVAGIVLYCQGVPCSSTAAAFVGYTAMSPLGGAVYVQRLTAGGYYSGNVVAAAVHPIMLQPGEVAQLYRRRLALLNRGF